MLEGEENLIQKAQMGSKECFGALYDHYIKRIYRFILIKVTNEVEAEDLTHEVFMNAWQNIKKYRHQGFPFSSWLYQIARNEVIDHYRLRKNNLRIDEVDADLVTANEDREHDMNVLLTVDKVREAMKELSIVEQDVLVMRFMEDLSYKEIAGTLNKSEGAIRVIQHRAIQALRHILPE